MYNLEYKPQHNFSKKQKVYLKLKRCFDILLALILCVLTAPIMAVAFVWIKLESRGSAIFKQRRPGFHQEIFTIYKFRTMRIEVVDDVGRPLTDKERETVSGRILRRTSIDELPQLVNILKGEMSFIGPRPFLINDLGTYNQQQLIRFDVLPGMTSWTAIHGRNMVSLEDKYNYEIYYVQHIGLIIDLEILLKTFFLVFSQKGIDDTVTGGRIANEIMSDINEGKRK